MSDAPLTVAALQIAADTPAELCKADRAVQALAGASRRRTLGLFDADCVWLNGQPCHAPWQRLAVGDAIEVRYDPSQHYAPKKKPPKHLGFPVLYEDADVIVVEKPAGWLTVPTARGERNTLIQRT